MRILILGAGDVGTHLTHHLSGEGHDVVVVEQSRERARALQDSVDALVVEGNGASLAALERAGIGKTDLLLAVTSQDEVNLMACLAAEIHEVPRRIARVSKLDYYDPAGSLTPERLGVDLMINPERECALEAYQLLQSAAAAEFAQFEGGIVQLVGVRVRAGAPLDGRTLAEMEHLADGVRALVVARVRGDETTIPSGGTRIEAGDQLFLLGEPRHLPDIVPLAGYSRFKLRRVVVAGGSREGRFLAETLDQHRIGCTLLETDRGRALSLAEGLERTLVLHGDATDPELLEMEGVGDADGFVASTGSDERNLLACLLAKSMGTRKVISVVDRTRYLPLVSRVGVDAAVSPRLAAVSAILRYVRGGNVVAVAALKGTRAEGIELDVTPRFRSPATPLAELPLPPGVLVGAIVRGKRVIIPRGSDSIRIGDRIVVFALPENLRQVERIFG